MRMRQESIRYSFLYFLHAILRLSYSYSVLARRLHCLMTLFPVAYLNLCLRQPSPSVSLLLLLPLALAAAAANRAPQKLVLITIQLH